jgi:hypothetical protein
MGMVKALYVLSGTGIKNTREWASSANEALRMVRTPMKLADQASGLRMSAGNPVSFFELKDLAELESHRKNAKRP